SYRRVIRAGHDVGRWLGNHNVVEAEVRAVRGRWGSRRRDWLGGPRRLDLLGRFGRFRATGLLQPLELALRSGEGALQAILRLPEPVHEWDLVHGAELLFQEAYLAYFH